MGLSKSMEKRKERSAKARPIHDSVAVILRVKDEVLICQREYHLTAFAGHWTFPGGRIDPEDYGPKKLDLDHPIEQINALTREAQEELGINLIEDFGEGKILKFTRMRTSVSPDFNPHRYQTHFYMVEYKNKPRLTFEEYEIRKHWWTTASNFLNRFNQGKVLTVPPIIFLMQDLCNIKFEYQEHDVPWVEMIKGLVQIMPKSVTLPPAERTNAFLIGDLLVDPSPKSDQEYKHFLKTLSHFAKPKKVMITHHHPDHIQYGPTLAEEFKIPLLLSQYTYDILVKKKGIDFFKSAKIEIIQEGDLLTNWQDQKVIAIEVPGHDEGQLALMPENKFWFIAGDLFQGIGSVVIPREGGHMGKYMESLKKVISLDPNVIIPSHGIPLGGTYVLKKLLEHREKRLEQVRELYHEGLSSKEMRDKIYIKLTHPKLKELALENIEKNIELIEEEKRP